MPPAPASTAPAPAAAGGAPAGSGGGLTRRLPSLLVTALAYIGAGLAALLLAIPPGYASPLCPAAGIALASVLVHGRTMLAAVAVGAFAVQLLLLGSRGPIGAQALALPALIALGATLQAAAGAALVRRFVGRPLTLTAPRDVARFLASCAASSVVSASVATAAMVALHALAPGRAVATWGTWWIGDLGGLLIVTPVALTLVGRPRSEWAPRRLSVGLTLTFVTLTLALGIVEIGRWNSERVRSIFDNDAENASLILVTRLQEPLRALEALHSVLSVNPHLSRAEMRLATRDWLGPGGVRALGWSERVRREDVPAFEARARAEGIADFRVHDRSEGAASGSAWRLAGGGAEPEVVAIRHVEPAEAHADRLGFNVLSVPTERAAILGALESGRPTATDASALTSRADNDGSSTVVVYKAVYDGNARTPAERRASLRGVAFATVAVEAHLDGMLGKIPPYLGLCLIDADPLARQRRVAGRDGCETGHGGERRLVSDRPFAFAGRQWTVRASADEAALTDAGARSAWLFAALGLLSAAMLGASLLTVTGRARRIESAVRDRTAALRAEVVERQTAESALRSSERRFRAILDNVPIGIVYTDLAGRIIQANPRFCELTGYGEAELAALSPQALVHEDDAAQDEALTGELVRGEIPMYRRHKRYLTQAGQVVWVRCTVSLLRDGNGQPWRIVAGVEDITERLRLEEAEHAREAAEASNQAKSDFLSRMSHELRTPLNAMLGFAQLLEIDQRHPLAAAQRPWVGQIQQAGWHLLEMINDVLDLSRIESGNLRLQIGTLELPDLVAATVTLVASDAAKRGIRISDDLAEGTAGVLGDATRVKQILTNLLSNAVKYNSDGGRVHVASRVDGDMVEIAVTDTGMGMTTEQMDGLFKPFNRLGRERTNLQGTGIGLVISRRLAELMGGSIRVKSVPGQGSSFSLRLPRVVDAETVPSTLESPDSRPAVYHQRLVHYIEDNETNVEVMRGILAQREQVDLHVSVTGLDGLAAVRARRPHLILLDMQLPDISGLELLRHLKTDAATETIPIVAVSADALGQHIDLALAAGAESYLTKPVDVAELLAVVDNLLDRVETGFSR